MSQKRAGYKYLSFFSFLFIYFFLFFFLIILKIKKKI